MSDDQETLRIIARALATMVGDPDAVDEELGPLWQTYMDDAHAALKALRAAGYEVVRWRPISEGYIATGPTEHYVTGPKNGNTTHFAILRGPEVKPVAQIRGKE